LDYGDAFGRHTLVTEPDDIEGINRLKARYFGSWTPRTGEA
jgi:hypothetical protein